MSTTSPTPLVSSMLVNASRASFSTPAVIEDYRIDERCQPYAKPGADGLSATQHTTLAHNQRFNTCICDSASGSLLVCHIVLCLVGTVHLCLRHLLLLSYCRRTNIPTSRSRSASQTHTHRAVSHTSISECVHVLIRSVYTRVAIAFVSVGHSRKVC